MLYSFLSSKTVKIRRALHEIIGASSLSIIFGELSFLWKFQISNLWKITIPGRCIFKSKY